MERNRLKIEVNGATLEFVSRRMPTWRTGYRQRDMNRKWREYREAPRMYVTTKDETIIENLENRRRRPYNVYKKLIAESDISMVLNLQGLRWSQNAGCTMCPCSPGFIVPKQTITVGSTEFTDYDIWATLTGAPNVDDRKPPRVVLL